jgi:hypothetical protein
VGTQGAARNPAYAAEAIRMNSIVMTEKSMNIGESYRKKTYYAKNLLFWKKHATICLEVEKTAKTKPIKLCQLLKSLRHLSGG